jgi:hypothetical protein
MVYFKNATKDIAKIASMQWSINCFNGHIAMVALRTPLNQKAPCPGFVTRNPVAAKRDFTSLLSIRSIPRPYQLHSYLVSIHKRGFLL